jgi:hypothetical protein
MLSVSIKKIKRSEHVKIMDRIYEEADQVIAYLGDGTEGTRFLFDVLELADQVFQIYQNCARPHPSPLTVKELDNLLARLYFIRVWVVQEVQLAPLATLGLYLLPNICLRL